MTATEGEEVASTESPEAKDLRIARIPRSETLNSFSQEYPGMMKDGR